MNRCPACGGEETTAGFAHRSTCSHLDAPAFVQTYQVLAPTDPGLLLRDYQDRVLSVVNAALQGGSAVFGGSLVWTNPHEPHSLPVVAEKSVDALVVAAQRVVDRVRALEPPGGAP